MDNHNAEKIKMDCFAFDRDFCRCRALIELVCKNESCPFYKTKPEYLKGLYRLELSEKRRKERENESD